MHNARACKIHITFTKSKIRSEVAEPAAAPSPVRKKRIGKRCEKKGSNDERGKFPSFRGSPCRDGGAGIHENHLKQEQHHDADVVGSSVHQEQTMLAEQSKRFAKQRNGVFRIQWGSAAQVGNGADTAHLDRKT